MFTIEQRILPRVVMLTLSNYLQFILLGAIWGGSFLLLRITSPVLGPWVVTDSRVLLGTLMLGIYALVLRKPIFGQHPWFKLFLLAILSCTAPFALIAFTEISLSASMGSILNATTPLYAGLLSFILLKEKNHYSQYIGLLLGIIGVIILVGLQSVAMTPAMKWAIAAILLATFFYACGGIYAAKTFTHFPPVVLVFWQQLFSFIVLLPFAIHTFPTQMPSKEVIFCLVCLGILCTGVAFLLYFHLIKTIGASKTISVAYIIPLFGILWGHLFLGEKIGPSTVLGTSTILFGIYLIYRKRTTPLKADEQLVVQKTAH